MDVQAPLRTDETRDGDITARLRDAIVSGRFLPNERLVETDLAAAFGANRANIRMALAMLDQEGLVVRERHRGARVRLVSDAEAIEIAEMRLVLESVLARQAAERATLADQSVLGEIVAEMLTQVEAKDFAGFSQNNARLHREIQRIAGNATAARLLQTLKSQIVRMQYRVVLYPGRPYESLAEHVTIVEAICAGDGNAAEAAMRAHLTSFIRVLRQVMALTG